MIVVSPRAIVVSPPPVPGVVGYDNAKKRSDSTPFVVALASVASSIEDGESSTVCAVRLVNASVQNPGAAAVGVAGAAPDAVTESSPARLLLAA